MGKPAGAPRECPIIMTGPSVPAIFAGVKTQTRRLVKLPEDAGEVVVDPGGTLFGPGPYLEVFRRDEGGDAPMHPRLYCPYGYPGTRLWVKEAWRTEERASDMVDGIRFAADNAFAPIENTAAAADRWVVASDNGKHGTTWRSPLFMPRWASRLTLELVEVRVQRLQGISDDDARAEGVEPYTPPHGHISPDQRVPGPGFDRCRLGDQPHRLPFADLWDRINGKRAPWSANPYVWALTFRRLP